MEKGPIRPRPPAPPADIGKLVDLVARLRSPDGCPWDQQQTLPDLRAYLLEEAHEVAAAIDARDWRELGEELGDLLFQIVFISRLAEEAAQFTLAEVIDGVESKMIARHPHVFGTEVREDVEAVLQAWEAGKLRERSQGPRKGEERPSLLSGLSRSLPALLTCYRMTQKAAGVGFDWSAPEEVMEKVDEELGELRQALTEWRQTTLHLEQGPGRPQGEETTPQTEKHRQVEEELGDLLFTLGNLARHLKIDPEGALAQTNLKYQGRFEWMEEALRKRGQDLAEATLEDMDALWEEAKEALSG